MSPDFPNASTCLSKNVSNLKSFDHAVMADALFKLWKSAKKSIKKKEIINLDLKIDTKNSSDDFKLSEKELLEKTADIFSTQVEHIPKTATRFLKDIEKFKKKMTEMVK